jgi:hypothetical protein
MNKLIRFFISFYFIFYFLFLPENSFSENKEFHIPLRRNEEVLLGFYDYEKYIVLSRINNILSLKKIYSDRRITELNHNFSEGEIIYVNFFEAYNINKFVYLIKNNDQYFLKIFDENFNLIYENRILDSNLKLINIFLWKEQAKLLFFVNDNNYLKIFSFDLNNNLTNSINTNIIIDENDLRVKSSQHYLFLGIKKNRDSSLFVFDRFLNLLDQSFWENLRLNDYDFIGNTLYLCGYDNNNYIKIKSYNFINRRITEYDVGEIKFQNLLKCDYLSGDVNDLFYLYDQNKNLNLRSLFSPLNLIAENIHSHRDKIIEPYHKNEEFFDGFINYIISNSSRLNILKFNIYNENFSVRNYNNSDFLSSDNNVVFLKNNLLNRLIIFNDN